MKNGDESDIAAPWKRILGMEMDDEPQSRGLAEDGYRPGSFDASGRLALVDGNIAEAATAAKLVEIAIRNFGSVNALVNNAGIYFSKHFTDYTLEDLRSLTSVNIDGFLFVSQFAIKQMVAQK